MAQLEARGESAAAAVVPMILLVKWNTDPALVARLRRAHSAAVADGKDTQAARVGMEKEAKVLASELFRLARLQLETEQGVVALIATGAFCSEEAGSPLDREQVLRQINLAEDLLATRVFKEALREEIATHRAALMRPADTLPTAAALELFEKKGDEIIGDLRSNGFSIIDDAVNPATCSLLLKHFSQMFQEGKLGESNKDSCNRGSFSIGIPNEVGAGPPPDMQAVKQHLAKNPEAAGAFETAFALRAALGLMIGCPNELQKRMGTLRLSVPPTVMMAVYPGGGSACYHRHLDWYPHESGNDREVTIMLYFNDSDWSAEDEGHLVVHHGFPKPDETQEAKTHVLPKRGRMVIFFSRTCWHEVRASAMRDRYALTLWVDRDS